MAQIDKISDGVYRISNSAGPAGQGGGFTFNQFLIKDEKNILIHTGAVQQFSAVVESIKTVIDIKQLTYIFISHFESDECGAYANFIGLNPSTTPVCGGITGRQIQGFGLPGTPQIVKAGDELNLGKHKLSFISYPSEMHLWEGLLAYDKTDKILFSSDLFVARGGGDGPIKKANRAEVLKIDPRNIPSDEGRTKCQAAVDVLDINLIAVGHGQTLDLRP